MGVTGRSARTAAVALDALRTPDGRYLIVRGRLWRASNPHLAAAERRRWTGRLMAARRALALGRRRGEAAAIGQARAEVDRAKRALGERGPVWWTDGAPDYNRRLVRNTPYREWFEAMQTFADAILTLLAARAPGSICPSEAARFAAPGAWRASLDLVREAGRYLAGQGTIVIQQRGRTIDPDAPAKGPIRYTRG